MNTAAHISSPVGVIAGGGVLPFAVARSLKARGVDTVIFGLRGFCDPETIKQFSHHWFSLGQFGVVMDLMRREGCRDITFIGTLVRPALSDLRFDLLTLRLIPQILTGLRGGDDHVLTATARVFEERGFRLLGIKDLAPDLLMPEGSLTRKTPSADELNDIQKGRDVLGAIGPYDVGQGAVVIDGNVVSIEDIGGTDSLLVRIRELRSQGRLRTKAGRGVLVKMPKRGQDMRLDLPALGPKTIEGVSAAGLAGLAVVAGQSVVAEPQLMTEAADKAGLFVVGLQP
jgi:DUF1009 family protein